ncbi:MAG: UxaA family hydrolase, partial [Oscillospiraceae bacterium]|nr:UxaA family hydrolase [Oscillospiraceae bacterium]
MIIHEKDNVEVNIENGHKYAIKPIEKGQAVIKYGNPIGYATENIEAGAWVHTHNITTTLNEKSVYQYAPFKEAPIAPNEKITFTGYLRSNGDVGIRNEVWIIVTVGCVNKIAERIAERTGAYAYTHPYGC